MGRKTQSAVKPKAPSAGQVVRLLRKEFPGAFTALEHQSPFQLLIATILSAQCTDERVNRVTPVLFRRYPDPRSLADADREELEEIIRSTGFFRMKARSLLGCSRMIADEHSGIVPRSMEELVRLPGVGRKTANVLLGQYYGITEGIVVDTHVHRLAKRLRFTESESATGAEQDLMKLFPKADWIDLSSLLILHGRKTCKARKPLCSRCVVAKLCPAFQAETSVSA
ncbi:MAG: endonuclease III [Ignavibacteria bacterium]|nr:endonuclease III [Ignavibacteria bacterium]